MKKWKKIQALILTIAMILSMTGTAFADQPAAGTSGQNEEVVIQMMSIHILTMKVCATRTWRQ